MKFTPWETYKKDPERLPIKEPPCSTCSEFFPQRMYKEECGRQVFVGVILCHAEDMERTFSCYRETVKRNEQNDAEN